MMSGRSMVKAAVNVHPRLADFVRKISDRSFPGSARYWERRYLAGMRGAGRGSAGMAFKDKLATVDRVIRATKSLTVLDLGCGPEAFGNYLHNVGTYLGIDVSHEAVRTSQAKRSVPGRRYQDLPSFGPLGEFDLVLSLEVIFHLVEDHVYHRYMSHLTESSTGYLLIQSTDREEDRFHGSHYRDRPFRDWIETHAPRWRLESSWTSPHGASDWFLFSLRTQT